MELASHLQIRICDKGWGLLREPNCIRNMVQMTCIWYGDLVWGVNVKRVVDDNTIRGMLEHLKQVVLTHSSMKLEDYVSLWQSYYSLCLAKYKTLYSSEVRLWLFNVHLSSCSFIHLWLFSVHLSPVELIFVDFPLLLMHTSPHCVIRFRHYLKTQSYVMTRWLFLVQSVTL